MVQTRDILAKITSVEDTQKITKAMQMVAASKMRVAEQRMHSAKPYHEKLIQVISHIADSDGTYSHPFLASSNLTAPKGYIVISSDRGLCGGLNINLFKSFIDEVFVAGTAIDFKVSSIGIKAFEFMKKIDANVTSYVKALGDRPVIADFAALILKNVEDYYQGNISSLSLCYNKYVSSFTYEPVVVQVLPIPTPKPVHPNSWDYIYEPGPNYLLNMLMQRYIDSIVYQAVLENFASEHSARMLAMKNATDNAKELIEEFKLIYNKARQASITQELMEIISGANAV